jgi:ABC-type transport system involved in cytochrome c biogenesis permease subunit
MPDPHTLHMLTAMVGGIVLVPLVIMLVLVLIPYWFIWKKAGFSPWLSLLMFVPLINLVMLYVLAFTEWKVVPIAQLPPPGPRA